MAFTMPRTFEIAVSAECPSHARTDVAARQHLLVIDEPPQRGGTDVAATPLETLLGAYLGCTNVIANIIAEEMGIRIDALSLKLAAAFDTRGVFNKAVVTVPFPEIRLDVDITTDAAEADVASLRSALARRCPISVILRQAGSRIEESWTVTRPERAR